MNDKHKTPARLSAELTHLRTRVAALETVEAARQQAEEALRESEERFRSMFETHDAIMLLIEPHTGLILDANQAATKFYGYPKSTLCAMRIDDINTLPPAQVVAERQKALHEERNDFIFPHRLANGEERLVEVHSSPIDFHDQRVLFSIIHDITARQQAEEALRNSRRRLESIIEGTQIGTWEWNVQTGETVFNERWAQIIGYTLDELGPISIKTWETFAHPADLKQSDELLERHFAGELPNYDYETRVKHKDGYWVWVHDRGRVITRTGDGQPLMMFGTHTDITARKQMEAALRELNATLEQRVIERTTQLAATNLELEREIAEHRRADAALHYRLDLERLISAISTNFINLTLPEIDRGIARALQAIGLFANVDRSYIFQFTADNLAMDNTHEWCAAGVEPQITNLQGVPTTAVPWWMAQLQRFQTVYIPHVADLPPEAGAEKAILEMQSIQSVIVVPLVHGGFLVGFLGFDAVRQTKIWAEEDIRLLNIVGESVANTLARQRTDRALQQERTLLAQRVAERTAELSAANAELARTARLKDEFLANMSHELRTPLNAILSLSETLQEAVYGSVNDRQQKALRNIEESGRHLLALINDVLDLSKIGAGKVELDIEPVVVDDVCQAALRLIKETAHHKRLSVASLIDSHVAVVNADMRRLKQILVNLLSNAVKFTPEGGQIGLEVQGDAAQETVRFIIWDTGIGIAAENLSRLFKSFVQIDSRLSRQYEGTGLGLTLVARLVEMHGGSVSVESQLGRGSRFTVSLPWQELEVGDRKLDAAQGSEKLDAASGAAQPLAGSNAYLSRRSILVAEDNEMNLQALVDFLTAAEFRVTVARNGVEAIQRAQEDPPNVIIMDIQMPIMDGLEAIGQIRAIPALVRVPIIALTALAMPGDREQCLAAGANSYLSKPVRLKQLVKTIEAQVAQKI